MKTINSIINEINTLNSYKDLTNKVLIVNKYPYLEKSICEDEIPIFYLLNINEIEKLYIKIKLYLQDPEISSESEIMPIIESYDNTFICIGFGNKNRGYIYYFDFDFGCFLLDKNIDTFLSKLVVN